MTKIDPKDAALIAFIETIGNTGGIRHSTVDPTNFALLHDEDADEWIDLAAAYLLACEATGTEPIIKRRPTSTPIKRIDVYLKRSFTDTKKLDQDEAEEQNEKETTQVHALFEEFPDVGEVRVLDAHGEFLYFADQREGGQ